MIKGGYILQPRKIDESDVSKMPPVTRELWFYLLRKVNYKDNSQYKRGQGFFNLKNIQNNLEWHVGYRVERYSKPQLTKSLRRLKIANMIETMKATRGIIITVCNYDIYQNPNNYEGNDEGIIIEGRRKRQGHTKNKNTKEEFKNKELILSKVDISTLDPSIKKYYQIAISFWELVKSNLKEVNISNSEIENAKFTTWVDPIRLLMEKDGRTIEEFREIFQFLQKNDFWKEQIRSTAKLRKKNKDGITYFEALLTISRNEQQRNERKKSSEREKQSGVSDNYRKSILARLHNL
jgi:hypothetical protein